MLDLSANIVLPILHTFKLHWIPYRISMNRACCLRCEMVWCSLLPNVLISNLDCIQEIMSWFIMRKVFIPTTTCSRVSSVLSPCVGAGQSHCRTWQCQMLEDRQTFLQFPGDAKHCGWDQANYNVIIIITASHLIGSLILGSQIST